jgi:hypothetical protein
MTKPTAVLFWLVAAACGRPADRPAPDAAEPPAPDAPSADPTPSVTIIPDLGPPDFAAIQDGDGPWVVLTSRDGGYSAPIRSGRFSVVIACVGLPGHAPSVDEIRRTLSEGTTWYVPGCSTAPPAQATITGTIRGIGTSRVRVSSGTNAVVVTPPATAFTLTLTPGPHRVFAEELDSAQRPTRIVSVSAAVADGQVLDLDLATAFAPVTHTVSSAGPQPYVTASYRDARDLISLDESNSPTDTYRALPPEQLGDGLNRLQMFTVQYPQQQVINYAQQDVLRYVRAPVDQVVEFPAPYAPIEITAAASPYPSLVMTLPTRPGTNDYELVMAAATGPAPRVVWSAWLSRGWAAATAGQGPIAYRTPDLHALPGWQSRFELPGQRPISWSVEAVGRNDADLPFQAPPTHANFREGTEVQVSRSDGVTPAP